MIELLGKLFTREDVPLVTYEAMAAAERLDVLGLGDGVDTFRIPTRFPEHILFQTTFKALGELKAHRHDCKEYITIRKGSLMYGGREYASGDQIIIQPFYPHAMTAGSDGCTLYVEFLRPSERTRSLLSFKGSGVK